MYRYECGILVSEDLTSPFKEIKMEAVTSHYPLTTKALRFLVMESPVLEGYTNIGPLVGIRVTDEL